MPRDISKMVKLSISHSNLVIVSHQQFFAFSFDLKELSWKFVKAIKCTENVSKSDGSIECCAFSPCGKYFGICFDKNIIIYITFDWSLLHVCPGERRASSLQFFSTSKMLVIADKSGSATFYTFKDDKLQKTELALGHNSMLTNALITDDEKFVITSDRDEKIRVTNFPNVYNIKKYCLGHELFVSFIGFLPTDNRILISSSGDGTLRFWDFILGQQLAFYDCNNNNNNNSSDSKMTLTKFVSCEVNQMSIIAILEYKSSEIKIISIKGKLNTCLKIELVKVLTLKCVPWDIEFCNTELICLLPDKHNPVVIWSPDTTIGSKDFTNISMYLSENWDSFISMSNKISDDVPVLFKREIDNLQEYKERKKARLLKTGKTS